MKLSQLTTKTSPLPIEWQGEKVTFNVLTSAFTPSFAREMSNAANIDKAFAESLKDLKPDQPIPENPDAVLKLFLTKVESSDLTDDEGKPLELKHELFDSLIPLEFTLRLIEQVNELWMGKFKTGAKSANT